MDKLREVVNKIATIFLHVRKRGVGVNNRNISKYQLSWVNPIIYDLCNKNGFSCKEVGGVGAELCGHVLKDRRVLLTPSLKHVDVDCRIVDRLCTSIDKQPI